MREDSGFPPFWGLAVAEDVQGLQISHITLDRHSHVLNFTDVDMKLLICTLEVLITKTSGERIKTASWILAIFYIKTIIVVTLLWHKRTMVWYNICISCSHSFHTVLFIILHTCFKEHVLIGPQNCSARAESESLSVSWTGQGDLSLKWLLQWCRDLELDGAVRQKLQWKPPPPYPHLYQSIRLSFSISSALSASPPFPLNLHHRLRNSTRASTARPQPGFRLRRSAAASGFLKPAGSPLWPSWRTFWRKTKTRKLYF